MKWMIALLALSGVAIAQQTSPSVAQFVGTYAGTWQSGYGSGATVLNITAENGALKGRVVITGSPVGYKGDDLTIEVKKFADDIMTITFRAKHGRLTGSGIFQKGTFVGDYRFRYYLSIDRGTWALQETATASAPPSSASASH